MSDEARMYLQFGFNVVGAGIAGYIASISAGGDAILSILAGVVAACTTGGAFLQKSPGDSRRKVVGQDLPIQ